MADHPFYEVAKHVQELASQGHKCFQRFTCQHCGARQVIDEPNTFYKTASCQECGKETAIEKRGCNFMLVANLDDLTPNAPTQEVPPHKCPSCGTAITDATQVLGARGAAEPGDMTICLHCGHLMAFADDLTCRDLTAAEAHSVAGDPRILAIQKARGKAVK